MAVFGAACAALALMVRAAEGASLGLFLSEIGADRLPEAFLAVSLVSVPLAFAYMRLVRRFGARTLLAAMAIVLAAALAGARLLALCDRASGLFAAYLATVAVDTLLTVQWGVVLLDFFTVEESRRALPMIYAGGQVGGFAAGVLLRDAIGPLAPETFLVVVPAAACALVVGTVLLAGRIREGRGWREADAPVRRGPAAREGVGTAFALLRRNRLLVAIAASTALMVLLRLALRYAYGAGLDEAFASSEDLTRFIGTYTMVATAAGLVLQVAALPPLLRRFGVGRVNVAYAAGVLGSFAALAGAPGLGSAVAARFVDTDFKDALKTPLSAMFYEGIDRDRRGDARAIVLGVVSPIASIASSLALVAIARAGVLPMAVALGGAACSIAFVFVSHRQGTAYHRELESQLLRWHAGAGRDEAGGLEPAVRAGLASGDRRIAHLAGEIVRRRGS